MQTIEVRAPDGRVIVIEVSDDQYARLEAYARLRGLTFGGAFVEILGVALDELDRAGLGRRERE